MKEQQHQQIQVEQLFTKIGVLTWANDNMSQRIAELEKMCKALETENKSLKEAKE